MSRPTMLPEACFAPVITRRLAKAELLWQDHSASSQGFDPSRVYCTPLDGDPADAYTTETRVEWADRYGGQGIGASGGSGRCASYGDLQTKGVGPTSLVAHNADANHSSGAQTVLSAMAEAVFAQVFQIALPFGAVPTLAVLLVQRPGLGRLSPSTRTITLRPFVLRPAHFMRNVHHEQQRQPQGNMVPGKTRDAYRVAEALKYFVEGLENCLGAQGNDAISKIDAGLRELTRRLAWQAAASFAKRLPHGSTTCSNISLAGQFLDYGMSHALPSYRRPTDAVQDPWFECQRPLQTIWILRQQLDKYFPGMRGMPAVQPDELGHIYWTTLEERLGIEMAKMAGLTEDLALACPSALLATWLQAMRGIWIYGGREPLAPRDATEDWRPLPIDPKCPDLNRVLAASAPHGDPTAMDRAIAPLLADGGLRTRFVNAALAVRRFLAQELGNAADGLDAYLEKQARRKNGALPQLERDSWFRIGVVAQMLEADFQPATVHTLMADAIGAVRHTLVDLAPGIPGATGAEQVRCCRLQTAA